jgi:hypothetical protein
MRSTANSSLADTGVSVVVPVRNGGRGLTVVVDAIARECAGRPHEILVVDDGSRDGSVDCCHRHPRVRVIDGPRRGAAAAVNAGLAEARYPLVAQIDQDVCVRPGWLPALLSALADPRVAAAQGWYAIDPGAPALSRMMAMDLEQRYLRLRDGATNHVCTGNVVWRRDAIVSIGGLDESLGYGYDNDLSYRLTAAGFALRISALARSHHRWRDGISGYLRQQYGFGYGRLDLVSRHPRRAAGDDVSPAAMMAHPLVMLAAIGLMLAGAVSAMSGWPARPWLAGGLGLVALLAAERLVFALAAWRRWRDPAALLFPVMHLLRDAAWVWAILRWGARRVAGTQPLPGHSMRPRAPRPAQGLSLAEDR